MGTIYILENKIDGRCYVGQTTKEFKQRFRQHQTSHSYIGKAIRKYGIDIFNKVIIEDIPEEKLDEMEIKNIRKYNSVYPNGYNFESGGNKNKHLHEEHKRKISEAHIGIKPFLGKSHSEETKKKLSQIKKGIPLTEEHKRKIGEALKNNKNGIGNIGLLGRHLSKETKKKISEWNRLNGTKPPSRKGCTPWNKGIKISEKNNNKA